MRLLSRRLFVGVVAAWVASTAPVAAQHHDRAGYTTLTESSCAFTGTAQWTGHPNTAQVRVHLAANFGDGPVIVAVTDTTPTFDTHGGGSATATWPLSSATDVGFFWTQAWLLDSDGKFLDALSRKSAKPLRAACG